MNTADHQQMTKDPAQLLGEALGVLGQATRTDHDFLVAQIAELPPEVKTLVRSIARTLLEGTGVDR